MEVRIKTAIGTKMTNLEEEVVVEEGSRDATVEMIKKMKAEGAEEAKEATKDPEEVKEVEVETAVTVVTKDLEAEEMALEVKTKR